MKRILIAFVFVTVLLSNAFEVNADSVGFLVGDGYKFSYHNVGHVFYFHRIKERDVVDKFQEKNLVKLIQDDCKNKDNCRLINPKEIIKKLNDKGIKAEKPDYCFFTYHAKAKRAEATLIEKQKFLEEAENFPILIMVKKFSLTVNHRGDVRMPAFSSERSFKGKIDIETDVSFNIVTSKNIDEVVDKITLTKRYRNDQPVEIYIHLPVFGEIEVRKDTRLEALLPLLEEFRNDLHSLLINYDWQTAINLAKKVEPIKQDPQPIRQPATSN